MKLTARKAVEICLEMWTWMKSRRRNAAYHKADWLDLNEYGKLAFNCPCCEYCGYDGEDIRVCKKCPLLKVWNITADFDFDSAYQNPPCLSRKSPFWKFEDGNGSTKDSEKIIEGCRQWLAEHPIKEKAQAKKPVKKNKKVKK